MENNKKHTLQIEIGQGFISTSTEEVVAFNEKEIKFRLKSGEKVIVTGENLRINGFNKQLGELKVVGDVSVVKYVQLVGQKIKKLLG